MGQRLAICLLLLLATIGIYGQTLRHGFVNYDDPKYVVRNTAVRGGLTAEGIVWAFTARESCNWHPLTWLSHMADCQVHRLHARGHHLTNLLLHAATAMLLFLALERMTGDRWPAAWVAALFAVHPLHVESVAWLAERKDVLSGLFFSFTLLAYAGYVRRPGSWLRYAMVIATTALGLMAKPMLVTMPFVLLLLDYWPLDRMATEPGPRRARRLLLEKAPLFALSALCCAVTVWAQSEAIDNGYPVALGWRLGNAAVSCAAYVAQSLAPTGLAVLYPHPGAELPGWQIAAAIVLLAVLSLVSLVLRRRAPFLLVGWLWFLGMLTPVIGLIQVGQQARADRYTYLPQIGLWIALVWGVSWLIGQRRWAVAACSAAAAAAVAGLAVSAWVQTSYWRDSKTLWNRTIACTGRNPIAHYNLGEALTSVGRGDEAIDAYRNAIREKPDYPEARYNLGVLLAARGQTDEAIAQYRAALQSAPDLSAAHCNLGVALASRGRFDEAIEHYQAALHISQDADIYNNLGNVELRLGRVDEAIAHYREALRLTPEYADAHSNLGIALLQCGRLAEAIVQFRRVLDLQPDNDNARCNLNAALHGVGAARAN
ncbi:MAG: tetratricopeptide repeat protein [Thermoguttaceae bacterium]